MRCSILAPLLLLASPGSGRSGAGEATPGPGTDPLAIAVERRDAERFAALLKATGYRPSAAQVQRNYLDGGGRGVAVFTPNRIQNAANLARAVAAEPDRYRYAVEHCLPSVSRLDADLRAIYLGYRGLLPARPLPTVHLVFGVGNSGGTAEADAQVVGLEVMCGPGTTPQEFRAAMRGLFAHETVHSWQRDAAPGSASDRDLLLYAVLREGVADYLASLVTGEVPNAERDRWARERERWLWAEFQHDRALVERNRAGPFNANAAGGAAIRRWVGNYGVAPDSWPSEVGYWVGMRVAQAYVERSADRAAAIEALLRLDDPAAILAASGYGREPPVR